MSARPLYPLIRAYLGVIALAFAVSFSTPLSCVHGTLSSWQATIHFSEIHNTLDAEYLGQSSGLARAGSKTPESRDHHTHTPGEDLQAPLSQAAPDHLSVVMVPAPSVGWAADESSLGLSLYYLPPEPPPRQVSPS